MTLDKIKYTEVKSSSMKYEYLDPKFSSSSFSGSKSSALSVCFFRIFRFFFFTFLNFVAYE